MPESSKPGWRQKKARGAAGSASGRGASWAQPAASAGSQGTVFYFRIKLAAVAVTAIGLTGLFVYFVYWMARKTPVIAIAVTVYDHPLQRNALPRYARPLPPNAFASEDIQSLAVVNQANIRGPKSLEGSVTTDLFWNHLDTCLAQKPGGPNSDVRLVSALTARSTEKGEPAWC